MYDNPFRSLGFIAQDVYRVLPEAVFVYTSDENHYYYLYYDKITALLNEGINELNKKVVLLENRVAVLENK